MQPTVERERHYWEEHDDFDWLSDESKLDVIGRLPSLKGAVLELCCGSGMFTVHLPRTYDSLTGLDISQSLLNTLKQRAPHINAVQGNAQELQFPNDSFDVVLIFAGLHHLPNYQQCIEESRRVLRPGGVFTCLEPNNKAWYRKPMWWMRDFIGIYSEDEVFLDPHSVQRALSGAGFRSIETRYLTPRLRPSFLNPANKLLASLMYSAAALGSGAASQSMFLMSATR